MTVSGKEQRGSDIHIHCEYILKKYETLQEQEVTVLSDRSHVAPGPCPLRQEQEAQSEGRRGVSQAKAPDFLVWGPQTLLHLSTALPAPRTQSNVLWLGDCLWTSPLSWRGRGHSQDAMVQNCHVDGFHLHIAQRQHSKVLIERV